MKRYILKTVLSALLVLLVTGASAQALRSAYFLEGYSFRHQMNPAFMGESNYVSIPFLGNLNVGMQGNVGLNNFIYKYNQPGSKYKLTTFMNSSVEGAQFLDGLSSRNKVNANINLSILSFGFYQWGGFNTFDLGLRSQTGFNLPYDLFDFMKTGMDASDGTHYNLKNLTLRTNNYVEMAFGHARKLDEVLEGLTVGAKFKVLLGAGNVNAYIRNMDIYMSGDKWQIEAEGRLEGSVKGAYFKTKEDYFIPDETFGKNRSDAELIRKIDGFDIDGAGVGGWGLGLDLGATYKMDRFVEGLTVSAALLDLGFINWNHTVKGKMLKTYTFGGFNDIGITSDDNPLDDQFDNLGDSFEDFVKFQDDGVSASRTTMLAATLNLGAEYVFPYYKKLKFGFLSSTHINKPFTWSEGRLSANVAPVNWFDASINYACSTFGSSLGWILNFHPQGFNFFIGTDHMITKVTPQFIPVAHANANISLGFNITFGDKK